MIEVKKLFLILPILAIATLGATGCNRKKKTVNIPRITYGTYIDQTAREINYDELYEKAVVNEETMLLAVYKDNDNCSCWKDFHVILDKYVKTYNTKVYYIARSQFSSDSDRLGLHIVEEGSNPTFALLEDGSVSSEYTYNKDTKLMFQNLETLRSAIKRIARDPNLFMVDQTYLDNALFTNPVDKAVVQYIWRTCPDCNDCLPEVLLPYSFDNEFSTNIWLIDLEIEGLLLENGEKATGNDNYVEFMKNHFLSDKLNATYGYDRGFVPTIQVWEKGVLKDANVYFNDALTQEGDVYKVTRSYYTTDRVAHLAYTDTVLQGLEVPATDVTKWGSWSQEAARKYHKPILESFLDMYVK